MRALMMGVLSDQPASKVYFENEFDLPPKFRVNLRRLLREIQQVFEDIITEGVAQGVFQGEPRILAKHVLSICAWPYRWFSPEGQMSLDEFINSAVNRSRASARRRRRFMSGSRPNRAGLCPAHKRATVAGGFGLDRGNVWPLRTPCLFHRIFAFTPYLFHHICAFTPYALIFSHLAAGNAPPRAMPGAQPTNRALSAAETALRRSG